MCGNIHFMRDFVLYEDKIHFKSISEVENYWFCLCYSQIDVQFRDLL